MVWHSEIKKNAMLVIFCCRLLLLQCCIGTGLTGQSGFGLFVTRKTRDTYHSKLISRVISSLIMQEDLVSFPTPT